MKMHIKKWVTIPL